MSLYSIGNSRKITSVPHAKENAGMLNSISEADMDAIVAELNRRIDEVANVKDKKIITAGWIPGHDWSGTVWNPIYEAAKHDKTRSGLLFGAIVFGVMMDRDDDWSFIKDQTDDGKNDGITYFRIDPPR
ncbi:MAG: hypothetical protein RR053_08300 [Evtepia sp.]